MNCTALVTDDSFEVWTSTQVAVGLATHALQRAWITEQVPQCGYCQSGQIIKAAELLASNPNPTRDQIVAHMAGNICRCGTYLRIVRAIQRAAQEPQTKTSPESL